MKWRKTPTPKESRPKNDQLEVWRIAGSKIAESIPCGRDREEQKELKEEEAAYIPVHSK